MTPNNTTLTVPKNQTDLARHLGISKGVCSQNVRAGMPTSSVEAARAWRRAHLCPMRSKAPPPPPRPHSTAMEIAQGLMYAAGELMDASLSLDHIAPGLKAALRAVPHHERGEFLLHEGVMRELLREILAVDLGEDEQGTEHASEQEMNEVGAFWYAAACGEWELNPPNH